MAAQLDLIGLIVEDMAAALAFYRKLGLDIPAGADAEPHVEHTLDGGIRLAWDTVEVIRSFNPTWEPPTGGHKIAMAFRCESPAAVDEQFGAMLEAGYDGEGTPFDVPWGQRYAILHDPDHNMVELFCDL